MRALLPLLLLVLWGCGGDLHDYMPLNEHSQWEYIVRLDTDEVPVTWKVAGRAPVGAIEGWEIASDMGTSRLGWKGDDLLASELAGTVYSPPVPLLADGPRSWKGVVTTAGQKTAGSATLVRSAESLDVGGKSYESIKTVLTLDCGGETVQLTTWFFSGLGILRQEQRRGPALTRDRYIEFVSGS